MVSHKRRELSVSASMTELKWLSYSGWSNCRFKNYGIFTEVGSRGREWSPLWTVGIALNWAPLSTMLASKLFVVPE